MGVGMTATRPGRGARPEHLAVRGGHADDISVGQLDVLPHAADLLDDQRGIMGCIREACAAPEQGAGLLVQRHDRPFGTAGSDDHLLAVNDGRFGIAPAWALAAEVLIIMLAPKLLARVRFEANQVAPLADCDQQVARDGWRAARPGEGGHARGAGLAELRCPDRLAVGGTQGKNDTGIAFLADGVDAVTDDGHVGVTLAQTRRLPQQRRSAGRQLLQQAGVGREVVAVGTTELRPIGSRRQDSPGQEQQQTRAHRPASQVFRDFSHKWAG